MSVCLKLNHHKWICPWRKKKIKAHLNRTLAVEDTERKGRKVRRLITALSLEAHVVKPWGQPPKLLLTVSTLP